MKNKLRPFVFSLSGLCFLSIFCGLALSILNNGSMQGLWKLFLSSSPAVCLVFTSFIGVSIGSFRCRNSVLVFWYLVLIWGRFSGLRHLVWWIIVVNLVVQSAFFVFGIMLMGWFESKAKREHSADVKIERLRL